MYHKPTRRGTPTPLRLPVQCLSQDLTETSFSETVPFADGQDEHGTVSIRVHVIISTAVVQRHASLRRANSDTSMLLGGIPLPVEYPLQLYRFRCCEWSCLWTY